MLAQPPLVRLFITPAWLFLLVLGAIVSARLLTGPVATRGLLRDVDSLQISATRVQMLIGTVAAAVIYATAISHASNVSRFPAVDVKLLALLAGSNALFISARVLARLRAIFTTNRQR